MGDINKALELYDLMATRHEKSGFGKYQAQYYRDCMEIMRQCSTAEE